MKINSWNCFTHSCFSEQYNELVEKVKLLKEKHPTTFQKKSATKLLFAIQKLIFEVIPTNPALPSYRHGGTAGINRHWFRAKFFKGRFRLFFRYDHKSKTIIYGWVNDESTLRTYGSKSDAYSVFKKMLVDGTPPDAWDDLKRQSVDVSELIEDRD
ncbi:type II toxin-antitoxin system YhaV family toxin [Vibrio sp. JC009]|uniref:type II toxin-antitoxin system YhaV family toxin n=1 Tax=Vibrio sp. JC009 TaxID=2912314 RepID=UPI0023AF2818|nr:type II toxin-antitoxin system YhaV family toxin [Vibrio sp. JC009]WED23243.1 type II toxin-antitoxin system YhaV family toxin [Vibrio sp. JC009]